MDTHLTPPVRGLDTRRQLKVMIPTRLLIGLHSLRVLEGVPISDAVSDALAEYLREGESA